MKKLISPFVASLFLLAGCSSITNTQVSSTGTNGSLKVGQSFDTELTYTDHEKNINGDISYYKIFTFNSGNRPPHSLKITSYHSMGGLGALSSGNQFVYPAVVLKDKTQHTIVPRLVSRKAVAPGWVTSLSLETEWALQLKPREIYSLIVTSDNQANPASVKYRAVTASGPGLLINPVLKNGNTGKLEIQLN